MNLSLKTICFVSLFSSLAFAQSDTLQNVNSLLINIDSLGNFLPDQMKNYSDDFFSLDKNKVDHVMKLEIKHEQTILHTLSVESPLEFGKEISSDTIELSEEIKKVLNWIGSDEIYFGYRNNVVRKLKYHNYDSRGTTYCEISISSDLKAWIIKVSKEGQQQCYYFFKDNNLVGINKDGYLLFIKSGLTEFQNEYYYLSIYNSILQIEKQIQQ